MKSMRPLTPKTLVNRLQPRLNVSSIKLLIFLITLATGAWAPVSFAQDANGLRFHQICSQAGGCDAARRVSFTGEVAGQIFEHYFTIWRHGTNRYLNEENLSLEGTLYRCERHRDAEGVFQYTCSFTIPAGDAIGVGIPLMIGVGN